MIHGMAKTTSVPLVDLPSAVTVKRGGGYFLVRKDLLNSSLMNRAFSQADVMVRPAAGPEMSVAGSRVE
jgi:hypothetical protein